MDVAPYLGRTPRRLLTLAAAILVALSAAASRAEAQLPPQGLYEQCAPNSTDLDCGARLDRMASGGFVLVLNYTAWFGNAEQVLAYADRAHRAGLRVIWPLNHPAWRGEQSLYSTYRHLRPDCACGDDTGFFDYAIDLVKDHPATWGFYVGDELPVGKAPLVADLESRVKARAPHRRTLYVALENGHTLGERLAPFASAADVAAADYYPIGWHQDPAATGPLAEAVQRIADGAGRRSAMVLQAFSWGQYENDAPAGHLFPSRAQMLEMRDLALRNSRPEMLLWYSYNDVFRSDDPERRWADLTAAAFAPFGSPRPARLAVRRARIRPDGRLDVLARITRRAHGRVEVRFRARGRSVRRRVAIDTRRGTVRLRQRLPRSLRRARTGIVELRYPGSASVRPDRARQRAMPPVRPARSSRRS